MNAVRRSGNKGRKTLDIQNNFVTPEAREREGCRGGIALWIVTLTCLLAGGLGLAVNEKPSKN